jgi:hypothetical protein
MDGQQTAARARPVTMAQALELLRGGEILVQGQFPWSSNYTFLVSIKGNGHEVMAVYKPCRGERPLWDFDSGTLCRREVATYAVSRVLGWPDIPPVVLREGPQGLGSVQLFVEADYDEHYFTLRERLSCGDAFRRVSVFDYLVNNADRKGGHLLAGNDGRIWAIDHGLTFHVESKLRTVIWDYAGQPLAGDIVRDLHRLRRLLDNADSALLRELRDLISPTEIAALRRRLDALLRDEVYPNPRPSWRNVPYPLV